MHELAQAEGSQPDPVRKHGVDGDLIVIDLEPDSIYLRGDYTTS